MRKLLVALLLVPSIGVCKAKTAPTKPVEPTAIGIVYRLDPTSQELKRLPDEQWKKNYRFSVTVNFEDVEVKGVSSTFRIKASESIEFIFKTGSPEKVSLYRFVQKGKRRYFDVGQGSKPIKGLSIEVSQFGASSYKLVPISPLTPGEYAIIIADELYTFGVDQ